MDQNYTLTRSIGYLGLVPFITGAFLSVNIISIPFNLKVPILLFCVNYAAIILSFMGGVLWGYELAKPTNTSRPMLLIILSPPLWAAFALVSPLTCFLLALGFAFIYWLDIIATRDKKSPHWWLKLRAPLNSFAILSLIIMGFNE